MKIGLPTALFFKEELGSSIEKIIALDADCIEVVCESYHFPPNKIEISEKAKNLLENENVEPTVHASFFDLNMGSYYPKVRDFTVDRIKQSIDFSSSIKSNLITVHPGYFNIPEHEKLWKKLKQKFHETLTECNEFAKERGVKIGLENIQVPYFFYSNFEELASFTQNRENIYITLDIGHNYLLKKKNQVKNPEKEISKEIKEFKKSISHIHLHDNHGNRDEHLPPGDGEINFDPIIETLVEIGYENNIVVEVHAKENFEEKGENALITTRELFDNF